MIWPPPPTAIPVTWPPRPVAPVCHWPPLPGIRLRVPYFPDLTPPEPGAPLEWEDGTVWTWDDGTPLTW